jgi:FKBP-type peptidyl-prolyl cis-trans isomerase FkpA
MTRARRSTIAIFIAPALLALAACGSDTDTPTTPTGGVSILQAFDVRVGTGPEAVAGRRIEVRYTGWLYDESKTDKKGTQFDSGTLPNSSFPVLTLGAGQVIAGWDQGLVGMKVGGLRRLYIPPSLGYGARANGPIPANSSLVFDVELLGVQ